VTLLITYIDFHWDNYQGGSGKSYTLNIKTEIPDNVLVGGLWSLVHEKVKAHSEKSRPFHQKDQRYVITKVEMI
jgi:hypothetical protein